jgi:hypothetical protein
VTDAVAAPGRRGCLPEDALRNDNAIEPDIYVQGVYSLAVAIPYSAESAL